jgi:hypothetical protein
MRTIAITVCAFLLLSCAQIWENPVVEDFALVRNLTGESTVFYPNSETIGFRIVISDADNDLEKVVITKFQDTGAGFAASTELTASEYSISGSGSVTLKNDSVDSTGAVTGAYYYRAVPYDSAGNIGRAFVVQASVVEEPKISASAATYDFGSVSKGSTSPAYTFTITVTTTAADVVFDNLTLSGTDASEFRISTDALSRMVVEPTKTGTVSVVFSPISAGAKTATLNIPYGHIDVPYLQITLTGTATP